MSLTESRKTFLSHLFGNLSGFISIASIRDKKFNEEKYFYYPQQLDSLLDYIETLVDDYNVYFSTQLCKTKNSRKKENIKECNFLWADLDTCHPGKLLLEPTIVLETSMDRFQGFWKLDKPIDPITAEDLSRRIAYYHADDGADKSGWDLSQLLRVPFTTNFNHEKEHLIKVTQVNRNTYTPFEVRKFYPEVEIDTWSEEPLPDLTGVDTPDQLFLKFDQNFLYLVTNLFQKVPDSDWSKPLWALINLCIENGLDKRETFVLAKNAKCNKYDRDERPDWHLWRDVLKAFASHNEDEEEVSPDLKIELLKEEERKHVEIEDSIIENYVEYGAKATDADIIYHKVNAFMVLSCLLAGQLRIEIDESEYIPNLWCMILGESTYTRKSTTLDIGKKFVEDIDPDCVLATDASPQGILRGMAARPNRTALFFRDEFQGFIKSICRNDFMTGMTETFTQLYNGDTFKRYLANSELLVKNPVFVLWGGGIRDEILSYLSHENVTTGFLPRFLFVSGEIDITRIRLRGKKKSSTTDLRNEIYGKLAELYNFYQKGKFYVELTDEAVDLMNRVESQFLHLAFSKENEIPPPVFDRALVSGIKMAALLAATRMDAVENRFMLTKNDMERAFYYLEQFLPFSIEVVQNIGISVSEKQIREALELANREGGITKSRLMKKLRLESRRAEEVIKTLEDRGQILVLPISRGIKIIPKG